MMASIDFGVPRSYIWRKVGRLMFRLIKILFKIAVVCALGVALFTALMFGAKIWGVYSVPPTKEKPSGATLIVVRYDDEPFLNAADRPRPPDTTEVEQPREWTMYPKGPMKKRPVHMRTVVSLPYIAFIHKEAIDTSGSR